MGAYASELPNLLVVMDEWESRFPSCSLKLAEGAPASLQEGANNEESVPLLTKIALGRSNVKILCVVTDVDSSLQMNSSHFEIYSAN